MEDRWRDEGKLWRRKEMVNRKVVMGGEPCGARDRLGRFIIFTLFSATNHL